MSNTATIRADNIGDFVARLGMTMTVEVADFNPYFKDDEWARGARHWRCRLRVRRDGKVRQWTVPFSQGSAHTCEPTVAEVIDCLASDASAVENVRSFEEWAVDLGYDLDSRKAERTYKACIASATRLRRLLGDDNYTALLWNTERL